MDLEKAIQLAGKQMACQFDFISTQYRHRGLTGSRKEEVVREFLRTFLPVHLEVSSGELFDSSGAHSGECDVIVSDRSRVPRLLAGNNRLIPVEGAYCVLEIKTKLDRPELKDCLGKMEKAKSLSKRAFFPETGMIRNTFDAYGKDDLECFPLLFSVFAQRSIKPHRLLDAVAEFCKGKSCQDMPDSIVSLEGGWVMCWHDQDHDKYDLLASPGASLVVIEAGVNTLLLFFLMLHRWLSQAHCRPIRMLDYARSPLFGEPMHRATIRGTENS